MGGQEPSGAQRKRRESLLNTHMALALTMRTKTSTPLAYTMCCMGPGAGDAPRDQAPQAWGARVMRIVSFSQVCTWAAPGQGQGFRKSRERFYVARTCMACLILKAAFCILNEGLVSEVAIRTVVLFGIAFSLRRLVFLDRSHAG
ncbi:MAG: hypothetical protein E4G89_05760 [Methanothrix sp.]|nr:MAG: hypothetical protein E4G89_05760 [Methanothrix sp.]